MERETRIRAVRERKNKETADALVREPRIEVVRDIGKGRTDRETTDAMG